MWTFRTTALLFATALAYAVCKGCMFPDSWTQFALICVYVAGFGWSIAVIAETLRDRA